jgi:hypothetical protein
VLADRRSLPRLIRIKTASEVAGISIRHFYRVWDEAKLPRVTIRHSDFVDRELLLKLIETRRTAQNAKQGQSAQIRTPQELAIYLRQVDDDRMRDEVFQLLKPMLRFRIECQPTNIAAPLD